MLSPLGSQILGSRPPPGCLLVPLSDESAPLRLCILTPDTPNAGPILLRDTFDARVYLACICDSANTIHRWLELWVQDLDGLANSLPAKRQVITNASLDARWSALAQTLAQSDPASILTIGSESTHPAPTIIDPKSHRCLPLLDPDTGQAFSLCRDDNLLTTLELDPFSTTLQRYLYVPSLGPASPFIATTSAAKTNPQVRPLPKTDLIPLNPAGGLMLARPLIPFPLEPYIDFLSGASTEETLHNDPICKLFSTPPDPESPPSSGWLLPGDPRSRLLETFHLKLSLLADAVNAVSKFVRLTRSPLLNIGPDSFRVQLGEISSSLPALWTAAAHLVKPGDAVEVPVPSTEAHYYLPGRGASSSVYRPPPLGSATQGQARVRIRRTLLGADDSIIIEGTLSTQDLGRSPQNDLLSLRLNLPIGRVDFFARLESQSSLAAGEWRFRTIERKLPAGAEIASIRDQLDGASFTDVAFESLPMITTPCDLYALAVVAVRMLLVNPDTTLPEALDDLQSLARQTAGITDKPLPERVAEVFRDNDRWLQALGPHRLTHRRQTPTEAFDLIHPSLWWETLAAVIRMLPGADRESACADFSDARSGGLHKTFERASSDLEALVRSSRGLIVVDWTHNREIDAVIQSQLTVLELPV